MTVYEAKDYINVFDAGQSAVDRGDYRHAYDCFMACLEYKNRYEPYDERTIENLEKLVKNMEALL